MTTRDLTWVVALAAALWGTDALLRLPLALESAAPTIVFAEHAVLVLVLLPILPRAIRAFGRLDAGGKLAVVAIGAGASQPRAPARSSSSDRSRLFFVIAAARSNSSRAS